MELRLRAALYDNTQHRVDEHITELEVLGRSNCFALAVLLDIDRDREPEPEPRTKVGVLVPLYCIYNSLLEWPCAD